MAKITMTQTVKASPDGIAIKEYEEGKTYDVSDDLANELINLEVTTQPMKQKKVVPDVASETGKPDTGRGTKNGG